MNLSYPSLHFFSWGRETTTAPREGQQATEENSRYAFCRLGRVYPNARYASFTLEPLLVQNSLAHQKAKLPYLQDGGHER